MRWRRCRLDWLITEERDTVNPTEISADSVFHYSIPALDEIGDGRLESPDEIGSGKLLLSGGEVLVSKLNPRLPRVLLAESHDVPTLASTEFIALRPGPGVDERFLRYWLGSEPLRQMLNGATMSATRSQQRVRPEIVTKSWLRVPSMDDQRAIADYLDRETARIDALVEKKRRLTDVLRERRQALITEAVRGEIAPGAAARGDRWNSPTVPLKRLFFSVRGGAWGTEPDDADIALPCVRGTDFDYAHLRVDLSLAPLRGFSRADVALRAARKGDLIIEKSGGGETQPVGRVVFHDHDGPVMPTNFAGRLRPARDIDSRFACYMFASLYSGGRTRAAIKQTTGIQNLDLDALLATRVRCPVFSEQRAIADYLDRETARIDALIETIGRQLALLQEHRQALITAAVTGELDVAGMAA